MAAVAVDSLQTPTWDSIKAHIFLTPLSGRWQMWWNVRCGFTSVPSPSSSSASFQSSSLPNYRLVAQRMSLFWKNEWSVISAVAESGEPDLLLSFSRKVMTKMALKIFAFFFLSFSCSMFERRDFLFNMILKNCSVILSFFPSLPSQVNNATDDGVSWKWMRSRDWVSFDK